MFLKSLTLRGFKTFADNTEVEFSPEARVTAIVGPNGCGKSNLMDATRWVLGEDNPRELRVAGLSNIIFAGTASKKPLSLAEVTMLFDNTDNKFNIPFSEVAIKRRTFREGESEFFINKNQCRLKDIKDLLLDTGLGEGTYSIITQGQVDGILSSKGEERRAVFEEAAGINKYKYRKVSAEKKLISAEQNILRISDLKVEVNENLFNLEDQAKKAKEYLEIQAVVKEKEIGLSKKLLSSNLEKREKLEEDMGRIRQEAAAKKESEEKDEQALLDLKNSLEQLEKEIDEILLKVEEEKDKFRDLELDRRFVEGESARGKNQIEQIENNLFSISQRIFETKDQLEKSKKLIDLCDLHFCDDWENLIAGTSNLVENISESLLFLGKENDISLNLGSFAEKEEAYNLKLDLLEEEAKKIGQEKEKLEFATLSYMAQLENLNHKIEEAKRQQSSSNLLVQKREEKDNLNRKIKGLEEKIKSEERAGRKSIDEETQVAIALAKLEGEMNGITERLSLEYNLTIEEALGYPAEITNISKTRSELESDKARLRSLEPVNLLAIEEFEKAKERLSFIEVQLADLSSARENLKSLIIELDQKAETTFVETMQKLSMVFSETFACLFAGGEAKITLAPDLPPLEAEIEIAVRPAGRKWLPLPLLSGGERSLCAIAILFSLLKIRPSPFCFLDEVDAALDDANIGRFVEMLKVFSEQSQIIVITHNKKTMAVADHIYGVTMEDPGVSKIISMKLAEVAA